MNKENKISIWIGKFNSKDEFNDYVEENYTEDGDSYSEFWKEFKIDYFDHDFRETAFYTDNITLSSFEGHSYLDTFIDSLSNIDFGNNNSVIILYDFEYSGNVKDSGDVHFVGVFDYQKDLHPLFK